jgi:chromosome segregation ATPase
MFNFLKKKKSEEASENSETSTESEDKTEKKPEKSLSESVTEPGLVKVTTEIDRIKASVEAFQEVRKSFTERFTRISEQIGELRSMILEDKTVQEIELKAIKAADLVESVQPEKIMTQVQKQEAKTEALKANLEGNESIMDRIMEELKETKKKIDFFRGVEEIIKLSEEVKKELIEIKKIESKIAINTDKVETIYAEIRKKFQILDNAETQMQEMRVGIDQNTKDINFLKDKMGGLAEKAELEKLVSKVQRYIDALKEIQKKSSLTYDIEKIKTIIEGLK